MANVVFELFAKLGLDSSEYTNGLGKANTEAHSVMGTIGNGFKTAAKIGAAAIGAATTAVGAFGMESIKSYANYEQLIGGVQTLYGNVYGSLEEYADGVGLTLDEAAQSWNQYQTREQDVLNNADKAYLTAGMSANEYMDTVNGFAAALNSSLGEYAWQSAAYADQAVGDMADNANKMGTSMESIQNAYSGFAKGNFTIKLMSAA
jgi:hypothetical protein